jgi:hypothetical protein
LAPSRDELLRLADEGLAAYPPAKLSDLCIWCADTCKALPDVRYCVLSDGLRIIADWFGERDGYGGVLTSSVDELNVVLRRVRAVVEEQEPAVAVALASDLQAEISLIVERGEEQLNAMYREPR